MLTWLISHYSLCVTSFSCMFKDIAGYKSKETTHLFCKELNGLLMESCFIVFIIADFFPFLNFFLTLAQNTRLFSHSHWVIYIEKVNLGESSLSWLLDSGLLPNGRLEWKELTQRLRHMLGIPSTFSRFPN